MENKVLKYEIINDIAYLTLNNPPGNIMSAKFFDELHEKCSNDISKQDFDGLIIKSEGRHFSGGANVDELLMLFANEKDGELPKTILKNTEAFLVLQKLQKPVLALLKGICYGSAFELALCAHYRWATPGTVLALPEVSFGLMPGLGGINNIFNKIGFAKTMDITLSSRAIFIEEALSIGLIDKIADKKEIEKQAIEFLKK